MDVAAEDKGMHGMRGKHAHIPTDTHQGATKQNKKRKGEKKEKIERGGGE